MRERAAASPTKATPPSCSSDGIERCARKFGEEAVETVIAAVSGDKAGLTAEAADVLYHLLVLLKARDVPLSEVMAALEQRTGAIGPRRKGLAPE